MEIQRYCALSLPNLVRHCQQRGCEIIGHGIGVRVLNSTMSEPQVRRLGVTTMQGQVGQPHVNVTG